MSDSDDLVIARDGSHLQPRILWNTAGVVHRGIAPVGDRGPDR